MKDVAGWIGALLIALVAVVIFGAFILSASGACGERSTNGTKVDCSGPDIRPDHWRGGEK